MFAMSSSTQVILFGTFALTFLIELLRYFWLLPHFNLQLTHTWRGGWRYSYHVPYLALCAGGGSGLATLVTWLLGSVWDRTTAMVSRSSGFFYVAVFFFVLLTGVIAVCMYLTLRRVWSKGGKKKRLLLGGALLLFVFQALGFLWRPTRFLFGGTLLLLLTSVFGQQLPFSGSWEGLGRWMDRRRGEEKGTSLKTRDEVPVRFFIEAEGYMYRHRGEVESTLELVTLPTNRWSQALAKGVLERSHIREIAAAQDKLHLRREFLEEIPRQIFRNLRHLINVRESLSKERRGLWAEKEEEFRQEVRNVLRPRYETRRVLLDELAELISSKLGQLIEVGIDLARQAGPREIKAAQLREEIREIIRPCLEMHRDRDLLDQIPRLISENMTQLIKMRESLSKETDRRLEERERDLQGKIRKMIDDSLGDRLQGLLYWHYKLPQSEDEIRISISMVPQIELKPLITIWEYFGLFQTWLVEKLQQE